jgi:hypothetical protein
MFNPPTLIEKLVNMSTKAEAGISSRSQRLPPATVIGAVAMAISVAVMVAGEAGAGLVMLCWAAANLLGLPFAVFVVGAVASTLAGGYLAVLLFVRVYRIETRRARAEDVEDVGWKIFSPN